LRAPDDKHLCVVVGPRAQKPAVPAESARSSRAGRKTVAGGRRTRRLNDMRLDWGPLGVDTAHYYAWGFGMERIRIVCCTYTASLLWNVAYATQCIFPRPEHLQNAAQIASNLTVVRAISSGTRGRHRGRKSLHCGPSRAFVHCCGHLSLVRAMSNPFTCDPASEILA
jgi:hypothetical protein